MTTRSEEQEVMVDIQIQKTKTAYEHIHLKDYLGIIKKRKRTVLLFSFFVIGLAIAHALLVTPVYQGTARIIIDRQAYPFTRADEAQNIDIRDMDYYQTQYELLQSRSLSLKVIKELELWKVYQADVPLKKHTAPPETIVSAEVIKTVISNGIPGRDQKILVQAVTNASPAEFMEWSDAIDWYQDNLRIEPVKGSRLININFRSTSPEVAARVANAHARAFVEKSMEEKIAASQQKLNWRKDPAVIQTGRPTLQDRKPVPQEDVDIFSLPEVVQNPVVQNLRTQLIQLKTKRLEQITNYGPRHPKMIDLNSQIQQVDEEINREVQRLAKAVSSSFETSNISIVDEAEVPLDPIKPRRFLNIVLAIMMSLSFGPFLAFFTEYMDRTVKTPEDVERRLGMSILGTIPSYKTSRKRDNGFLVWDDSCFRKKKTYFQGEDMAAYFMPRLLLLQKESGKKVYFIESAVPAEGKTTVLANTALGLARRGVRVLVIDADILNPALHTYFRLSNDGGLTSIMADMLSLDIVKGSLHAYSIDDLFFLIALKRLKGTLTVTNDSNVMTALFEDGRLLHLQSTQSQSDNRLGTMLVRAGLITESQLNEAVLWHKRTSKPLGYVLVNAGFITQERLYGPIKLQMEEHLQRLFSWKQGTFAFEYNLNTKSAGDEKIHTGEDYSALIRRYGNAAGSRFIEQKLMSRILPTKETNLWLLPAGKKETGSTIGPANIMIFSKLLEILKQKFDVIFVDTPPVLSMPDAAVLSREGDGVLFVVKAGKLPDSTLQRATEQLQESGANILGIVLNEAKLDLGKEHFA